MLTVDQLNQFIGLAGQYAYDHDPSGNRDTDQLCRDLFVQSIKSQLIQFFTDTAFTVSCYFANGNSYNDTGQWNGVYFTTANSTSCTVVTSNSNNPTQFTEFFFDNLVWVSVAW